MRKLCFALVFGTLLATSAQAQVFQWRDDSGRLVYGDQPPPGVEATVVRTHPAAGSKAPVREEAAAPAAESATSQDAPSRSEREAIAKRTREQDEARERACQETRNYLAALESGQRVARFNEKGEREFLDDNARMQTIERTRATLRENCSK
ncbi:MAG: DUF4124 domain-containing protein [Pseudazoarcus pumilus]|nr:DUF4124 domain-containing protein [Pseudazoarcus pumilus]